MLLGTVLTLWTIVAPPLALFVFAFTDGPHPLFRTAGVWFAGVMFILGVAWIITGVTIIVAEWPRSRASG